MIHQIWALYYFLFTLKISSELEIWQLIHGLDRVALVD